MNNKGKGLLHYRLHGLEDGIKNAHGTINSFKKIQVSNPDLKARIVTTCKKLIKAYNRIIREIKQEINDHRTFADILSDMSFKK